ncbi:MAG: hypothetical protein QNI96_05060 [Woeseiaceae bacterium]|nr:hypothetical protein [Woeseiaceae bacterium]
MSEQQSFDYYVHTPITETSDGVNDALNEISSNLQRATLSPAFPTYSVEPKRVYNGLTLYADGTNWDPGEGAGLYTYHSGSWRLLSSDEKAEQKYVAAGYGSIRQSVSTPITIDAGWTTIPFDTSVLAVPKNVEQNIANNSLRPLVEGIVVISAEFTLAHNESNQGRVLNVRGHNLDDNVSTGTIPYAVARNQPGSNVSLQVMATIDADRVGDSYVIQVQAGSGSFSGVSVEYANFLMYYISEDLS